MPLVRYTHSTATMSWIDPRLFNRDTLPEVDWGADPGQRVARSTILGQTHYRFANYQEAYILVDERKNLVQSDFTSISGLYANHSFRGFPVQRFDVVKTKTLVRQEGDLAARFVQIVGAKTVSPETIGARIAVSEGRSLLGIPAGYEGINQLTQLVSRVSAVLGWKTAEQVMVFPPIWTELELTITAEGDFQAKLLRHSLFPSMSYYIQYYSRTTDVSEYSKVSVYDARSKMADWRARGWGAINPSNVTSGPVGGNPWMVRDPRILHRDIPIPVGAPPENIKY
jgi:hypothetical protein